MYTYIFGYGTLLNTKSRHQTFVEHELYENVLLRGYERVLNACHASFSHIAMNLRANPAGVVGGVVAAVHAQDLPALRQREVGYGEVDISAQLSVQFPAPVYTYIMQNPQRHGNQYEQRYLNTCLAGVPPDAREQWLRETAFPITNVSVADMLRGMSK